MPEEDPDEVAEIALIMAACLFVGIAAKLGRDTPWMGFRSIAALVLCTAPLAWPRVARRRSITSSSIVRRSNTVLCSGSWPSSVRATSSRSSTMRFMSVQPR